MTIRANGLEFGALIEGPADGEPVLVLHGFPQTSYALRDQIHFLAARGFRVLAPDQRGYSVAARPSGVAAYRASELVDDALAIASSQGWSSFHIVGHDWGAAIGWFAAARRPDRVRSLFAISAPHPRAFVRSLRDRETGQAAMSSYIELLASPGAEAILLADSASFLREVYDSAGSSADARQVYLAALGSEAALRGALAWYRAMDLDELGRVEDVSVPTTYVWGTLDETIGDEAAEATARYVTGRYRFIAVDHAGHWLPERNGERLNAELAAHFGRLAAGARH